MPATSVLSFVLLVLAGWLLDAHRKERLEVRRSANGAAPPRSAVRRLARRQTANVTIAVVGVLFALWPIVPREPFWVGSFAALLTLLALLIFLMGVGDAYATIQCGRRERRRQLAEQTALLRASLESARQARSVRNDPPGGE